MKCRTSASVGAAVAVAAILGTAACGNGKPAGQALQSRPDIFIVVIDTARRDHFSTYGYGRETSPALSRIAGESRTYTRAYSTGGWTSAAHGSLFTGLYAASHGTTQEHWSMADELTTLAEVLAENGYATAGLVENPMLSHKHGFDQGFDSYAELWLPPHNERPLTELFAELVDGRPDDRPLFAFVNIITPHSPYTGAGSYTGMFAGDDAGPTSNRWREFFLELVDFSADEIDHLAARYDEELLYSDHVVGEMFRLLKERGFWESSFFLVTADHGENIGDHGMMDHVFGLQESLIRVPFIVHFDASFSRGSSSDAIVQLTDVFPTVLDAARIPLADHATQGVSLARNDPTSDRPVFAEYYYPSQALTAFPEDYRDAPSLERFKRRIAAVIDEGHKLVWGSDGRHELYDLTVDPDERTNLIDDPNHEPTRSRLTALVSELRERYARERVVPESVIELDDQTREALRSLGYVQ